MVRVIPLIPANCWPPLPPFVEVALLPYSCGGSWPLALDVFTRPHLATRFGLRLSLFYSRTPDESRNWYGGRACFMSLRKSSVTFGPTGVSHYPGRKRLKFHWQAKRFPWTLRPQCGSGGLHIKLEGYVLQIAHSLAKSKLTAICK